MKDEYQVCNEAFARTLCESPEMYREFVKAIPGGVDYFRSRWEEDFGNVVDVSSFTGDEIIDKTFEINELTSSGINEEEGIREMTRILRIDFRILH